MSIKGNSKELDSVCDEWQGSWGSIMATPHSVVSLCLAFNGDRQIVVSYPYKTLSRWKWQDGEPETLEIQAGSHRIKVAGKGLKRLFDALELEQLKLMCESRNEKLDPSEVIWIYSILVDETGVVEGSEAAQSPI